MLKRMPFLLFVLVLAACSKSENTVNDNAARSTNISATTTSTPQTPVTTAAAPAKIGIPECDDYLARFDACISGNVPEAARAPYRARIESQRTEWQRLAANPQTKVGLARACKTAAEQQRTTMKSFKCSF